MSLCYIILTEKKYVPIYFDLRKKNNHNFDQKKIHSDFFYQYTNNLIGGEH